MVLFSSTAAVGALPCHSQSGGLEGSVLNLGSIVVSTRSDDSHLSKRCTENGALLCHSK